MATGKFMLYTSGLRYVMQSLMIDLDSSTVKAIPLHNGYTPGTSSHSVLAQVTAYKSTATTGSTVFINSVGTLNVTQTGNNTVKYTTGNIDEFSGGGHIFQTKYCVLYISASAAGIDNPLLGFFDLDPGAATGVEGTSIKIVVPTTGLFKITR